MIQDIRNSIVIVIMFFLCSYVQESMAQRKISVNFEIGKLDHRIENFNFDLYYMTIPNDITFVEKISERTFIIRNDSLIRKMLIPIDSSKRIYRDDTLMFLVKNNYFIYFIPVSVKLFLSSDWHRIHIYTWPRFDIIKHALIMLKFGHMFDSNYHASFDGHFNRIIRKRTSDWQPWYSDWYITDQFKIFPDSIYNPDW